MSVLNFHFFFALPDRTIVNELRGRYRLALQNVFHHERQMERMKKLEEEDSHEEEEDEEEMEKMKKLEEEDSPEEEEEMELNC